MDKKTRLITALSHIDSVDKLIIDEDYHGYMSSKLLMVEIELQRQLQKLTNERRRIPSISITSAGVTSEVLLLRVCVAKLYTGDEIVKSFRRDRRFSINKSTSRESG